MFYHGYQPEGVIMLIGYSGVGTLSMGAATTSSGHWLPTPMLIHRGGE